MTADDLIRFSRRVAAAFEAKEIHSPVHLCSDSQAHPLIDIFKEITPEDWICCSWRSSFAALLKGMPEDELFAAIKDGRSMFLCSAKYRIVSSAIVGGVLPIACGLAMGIARRGENNRVWVFCGDMCARTGPYHEFEQYCRGHDLPVRIVVEDNGRSTNAVTADTWGRETKPLPVQRYEYERNWPHCGIGKFIDMRF